MEVHLSVVLIVLCKCIMLGNRKRQKKPIECGIVALNNLFNCSRALVSLNVFYILKSRPITPNKITGSSGMAQCTLTHTRMEMKM